MKIVLSGASGFIGSHLQAALSGHTIRTASHRTGGWDPVALREADAVIHLAGEPVGQRWTPAAKQRILDSRVQGTRRLVEAMAGLPKPPQTLICASAIGYYGSRGDEILTESSAPGRGFLSDVCVRWEKEAQAAEALGTRVVMMRTGLVLASKGGALQRMLPAFRMGVGGRIGTGRQWMSWIHIQDLVSLIVFTLEHPLHGPVNGVAPEPVTNSDFTRALASALHRPAIFPLPSAVLQLLFGEMSEVLLASQRVLPGQAGSAGFPFRYSHLADAFAALFR
jgi:uncharacterized protein (TIGR01777 family)